MSPVAQSRCGKNGTSQQHPRQALREERPRFQGLWTVEPAGLRTGDLLGAIQGLSHAKERRAATGQPVSRSHRGRTPITESPANSLNRPRLRAKEQLESRALGKPKETVEHQEGKTAADEALDRMSTEDLEALVQRGRHLRAVQGEAAEH
jgi:hypothetical protein